MEVRRGCHAACCSGSSGGSSWCSWRLMRSMRPAVSSASSSGPVHRASGTPVTAGSWQAPAGHPRVHPWVDHLAADPAGRRALAAAGQDTGQLLRLLRLRHRRAARRRADPALPPRYGGSAHSFGFAIDSAAKGGCQDAVLRTGSPVAPQEALDTACTVHLAVLGHEPPQDLRREPLNLAFNLCCLPGNSLPVLSGVSP